MLLKGTNSRNSNFEHPNFGISELRTSRTLLLSPKVELNELELQKSRTVRTRTQVRSITNLCHSFIKLLAALIDVCKVAWDTIEAVNITLGQNF